MQKVLRFVDAKQQRYLENFILLCFFCEFQHLLGPKNIPCYFCTLFWEMFKKAQLAEKEKADKGHQLFWV